jgi:hypothetical protein
MFDSLTRRRRMYERHLLGLDDDELDDEELDEWDDTDEEERYYQDQIDDGESPFVYMARLAADIERGRAEVPRGWKLDRPSPEVLVWTVPSGRRYASTLSGDPLPLP